MKKAISKEEYREARVEREKSERQTMRIFWVGLSIVLLSPWLWLGLDEYKDGDLEIYLEYRGESAIICASKYTWWGLGESKHYEIAAIKGQWHIRTLYSREEWSPIYNFGVFSHKRSKERPPTYYGDAY